ncbi:MULTISPECIES: tyrosine-type recombinase/integrase [Vibrio]|uniref:tyrosine-type recombinase/integrase n=1 Tax=Vibrio TaxID=662 RepID=UPI001CDD3E6F|nr:MULTISPECIES: site-specific integrase [Vibrio]MCA2454304.1 site-specific integrase [Vibrio alginolyticus]MCA2460106.1 site-specific integrase [Vibrio alginolyticus]MDW2266491.1 site-specific integrase [Vibrio sp. 1394]MDW2293205.1 site-specific integrase [Vibrio sp. 1404]
MYRHIQEHYGVTFRQRGTSWQVNFYKDGKRVQRQRKTQQEAVDCVLEELGINVAQLKKDKEQRPMLVLGSLYVGYQAACQNQWSETRQRDWKKSRANGMAALDYFGHEADARDIDKVAVQNWIQHLEERGNSTSTINRKLTALRVILTHCIDANVITHLPTIPFFKETNSREYVISPSLEQRMVDYFVEKGIPEYADFITVAIATGCRCGELLKMRWEWVDLAANALIVHKSIAKNGKTRRVPLLPHAATIMARRKQQALATPFEGLTQAKLSWQWKCMKEALHMTKVKDFVPHIMRHTCASRLASRGVDPHSMMLWLGHGSLKMVERYAHLNPNHLQNVVKLMVAS